MAAGPARHAWRRSRAHSAGRRESDTSMHTGRSRTPRSPAPPSRSCARRRCPATRWAQPRAGHGARRPPRTPSTGPARASVAGANRPDPRRLAMKSIASSEAAHRMPTPCQSKGWRCAASWRGNRYRPRMPAMTQNGRLIREDRRPAEPVEQDARQRGRDCRRQHDAEAQQPMRPPLAAGVKTGASPRSIGSGCSRPAATPCTMRMATTKPKLSPSAPATLLRPSSRLAPRKRRRKPIRSSTQGVGSMATVSAAMKPVIAHCT